MKSENDRQTDTRALKPAPDRLNKQRFYYCTRLMYHNYQYTNVSKVRLSGKLLYELSAKDQIAQDHFGSFFTHSNSEQ